MDLTLGALFISLLAVPWSAFKIFMPVETRQNATRTTVLTPGSMDVQDLQRDLLLRWHVLKNDWLPSWIVTASFAAGTTVLVAVLPVLLRQEDQWKIWLLSPFVAIPMTSACWAWIVCGRRSYKLMVQQLTSDNVRLREEKLRTEDTPALGLEDSGSKPLAPFHVVETRR